MTAELSTKTMCNSAFSVSAVRFTAKKCTAFLWHPRIDKWVRGGGKLNSSKLEGFRLGVKKL